MAKAAKTPKGVDSSLKGHGGKHYLADWIISHMPPRALNSNAPAEDDKGWCHFVEPYFLTGAVMLRMAASGISEVANDINQNVTCFWRCLQDSKHFQEMQRILALTPFSQKVFQDAQKLLKTDFDGEIVQRAVAMFITSRMSRQGLGDDFATLSRNRTRRGMCEQVSAYLTAVEGLPEVAARVQRVAILNEPALKVIKSQDGPRTLFYFDPPYMHSTRSAKAAYKYEMTESDHEELLKLLVTLQGRFLLSGYFTELYHSYAEQNNWRRVERQIDNKASSKKGENGKEQKTECLWMNYAA